MKLQNNFTTPEQSKRLLELGLPADSADCCFVLDGKDEIIDRLCVEFRLQELEKENYIYDDFYNIPCWSVGRLIEILKRCILDKRCLREIFEELEMCVDEVKSLVQAFYDYGDVIDFSKLED